MCKLYLENLNQIIICGGILGNWTVTAYIQVICYTFVAKNISETETNQFIEDKQNMHSLQ